MTSPITLQPGESLQRLQTEWSDDFTDQFGRRYAANYDIRNMRPKEELRPVGFNPPWLPPMRYILWERHGGFKFRWDLETMANDLSGDATAYYAQVFEFMMEHMPGVEVPELGDPVPTKVLRSPIGKPPLSPAIPLACLAGEPWILGTPNAPVNGMLKAILDQSATANGRKALEVIRERMKVVAGEHAIQARAPEGDPWNHKVARSIDDIDPAAITQVSYVDFISAAMKDKRMTMAEAALAWKAHRENVAADSPGDTADDAEAA